MPFSPPHQLTEDLEYGGYYFPKGTNFVINILAACQAVDRPEEFDPERWMDGNESNITHRLSVFGGGRRICVGYRILQQMLFNAMARLIFCFDIVSVSLDFNLPCTYLRDVGRFIRHSQGQST